MKMGSVVTYKNDGSQCFCQIKFESGERVLISIAGRPQPCIKIMRLAFGGMIPRDCIWELDSRKLEHTGQMAQVVIAMFLKGREQLVHPLDAIRDALLPCRSIQEAVAVLKGQESRASSPKAPKSLVSKQDADRIFGQNKTQWEADAQQMVHPNGWEVRLNKLDSGAAVMSRDPKTGVALSVQPMFKDAQGPPEMLVIENYYPSGTFPEFSDQLRKDMEAATCSDLGPDYGVTLSFSKMESPSPGFDVVAVMLTRSQPRSKDDEGDAEAAQPI
jgi:hypothetical protein